MPFGCAPDETVFAVIPFFHRLGFYTAYSYLEVIHVHYHPLSLMTALQLPPRRRLLPSTFPTPPPYTCTILAPNIPLQPMADFTDCRQRIRFRPRPFLLTPLNLLGHPCDAATSLRHAQARFSKNLRTFASCLFIFRVIVYLAIVLYAPALALNALVGLPVYANLLMCGTLATL